MSDPERRTDVDLDRIEREVQDTWGDAVVLMKDDVKALIQRVRELEGVAKALSSFMRQNGVTQLYVPEEERCCVCDAPQGVPAQGMRVICAECATTRDQVLAALDREEITMSRAAERMGVTEAVFRHDYWWPHVKAKESDRAARDV